MICASMVAFPAQFLVRRFRLAGSMAWSFRGRQLARPHAGPGVLAAVSAVLS
jgi:hypothetical protein